MGTLLLAAAGSVGGTVAWFSANTTYSATAGNFAVGSLEGNLSCELAAGKGISSVAEKTVTVEEGALLADASYDHVNRTVWTDTGNNNGAAEGYALKTTLNAATGAEGTSNALVAADYDGGSKHVYWAVTWTMTFSYLMPITGDAANLYFDHYASSATGNEQDGQSGSAHTREGFRVAWSPITTGTSNATGYSRVWAPLTTHTTLATSTYSELKFVSGTSTGTSTNYTNANLMLKLTNAGDLPVAKNASSGSTSVVNCLGQFQGSANTTSKLAFVCVAWYEGEDPTVLTSSTKDIVSDVSMNFYVVKNAA